MLKPRDTDRSGSQPPPNDDDRGSATRRGLLTSVLALLLSGTAATRYYVGQVGADAAVSGLSVTGDSITTDNGQLTGLTADVSGHVSYDGLDTEAVSIEVTLSAAPSGGAVGDAGNQIASVTATVADEAGLGTYAGHRDYSFTGVDVLAANDLAKNDFAANGDGSTKDTDVDFQLGLSVKDTGGAEIVGTDETTTSTVSVTNEANSRRAGGSGNTNAQGSNQTP